jgi:glycogen operon protein
MILGGDEFRRTQQGNNNAYCHNNELSWFDWTLLAQNRDIFRFSKMLIAFRMQHAAFRRKDFFTGLSESEAQKSAENIIPDIIWYDQNGVEPQWEKLNKVLIARINEIDSDIRGDSSYLLAFNASPEAIQIVIPHERSSDNWHRVVDTSLASPHDFEDANYPTIEDQTLYIMAPRSFVLLISSSD